MVSLLRVPLFKSEKLISLSLFPPLPHPVRLLYPWNFPKLVSSASIDRSLPLVPPGKGFPGGSDGKASACNAGDPGLIPGSGRSSGEGNGNPL